MRPTEQKGAMTRRGFFKSGAGVLATAGILVGAGDTKDADAQDAPSGRNQGAAKTHSALMNGKIALEEHFALSDDSDAGYNVQMTPEFQQQIQDIGSGRIAEMDRGGVELCILSHVGPGIQAIPNTSAAVATSRRWNDYLAEHAAKNPKRLKGFAALPMQDPAAAAQELTRCVKELGFCGALVHSFSQTGEADSAVFYDLPQYRPFWATVQQLDVPFYLHPRSPLPTRQQDYAGQPWLTGSAWGFAVVASNQALRLMGSGLFDEYPKLKIILGHLGEGVPFGIWRFDHRISKLGLRTKAKLPMSQYLQENFYVTTSGTFRTQALTNVMQEMGPDRILYSVDYPYEDMKEASNWFDYAPIAESDRVKIAYGNAQKLFRL